MYKYHTIIQQLFITLQGVSMNYIINNTHKYEISSNLTSCDCHLVWLSCKKRQSVLE